MTATRPGEPAFDAWSLAHVATGLALSRRGLATTLGLLVAWEVIELLLRRGGQGDEGMFEYESPANIVADVAFGALGWGMGRVLRAISKR